MEMYCRELTERFEDVWVVSGPLTLPQTNDDGKKSVTYQVGTYVAGLAVIAQCMCSTKDSFKSSRLLIPHMHHFKSQLQRPIEEYQHQLQDLIHLGGIR